MKGGDAMTQQNAAKCPRCGSLDPTQRHAHSLPCPDDWHREPAAPPEGMMAAEWDNTWAAYQRHIAKYPQYVDTWHSFYAGAAHLRGEVARLTRGLDEKDAEMVRFDELRKQQIWQLEGELERLRKQVRQLEYSLREIIEEEDLSLRVKPAIGYCLSKGASQRARAALESITPGE